MTSTDAKKTSPRGNLMIIAATLIWGAGGVAQAAGMEHVSPMTFNGARFFLGGTMALGPALYFLRRQKKIASLKSPGGEISRGTLLAGIICGAILCLAINLQQYAYYVGIYASKVGFITTLYVIIVPIMSLVFLRKKAPVSVWIGVVIALAGMYFLSFSNGLDISLGDILVFLCAVVFSVQILLIGHFSPKHNVMVLACIQFYTVSIISFLFAFIFEAPSISLIIAGGVYVLYTGILSSGVAYILQMKAQKTTDPTVAAVLFSFEAVVLAVTAGLILGQFLPPRELLGCALIFTAVLVAQIPV